MKLFVAIGVLIVALSFQMLYTAKVRDAENVDSLEAQLGLLRKDLREARLELRRKSISEVKERKRLNNLEKRIGVLETQTEVSNVRSEQASLQRLSLNLQEGLITKKRTRQQIEKDLAELKTAIRLSAAELSEFQVAVARNYTNQQRMCECPTRSHTIAGWKICVVPALRFTRAYGPYKDYVVIEAGENAVRDGPDRALYACVRTDGLFPADRRHSWETELVWSLVSDPGSDFWTVGSVGVRPEGSDFGNTPSSDDESWGVEILCHFGRKKWRYRCRDGVEAFYTTEPVTPTRAEVRHRLGLLFDPADRTLTAVDASNNTRICSFSLPAVDAGSQSLVPLVEFWWSYFQRRFRLPGGRHRHPT